MLYFSQILSVAKSENQDEIVQTGNLMSQQALLLLTDLDEIERKIITLQLARILSPHPHFDDTAKNYTAYCNTLREQNFPKFALSHPYVIYHRFQQIKRWMADPERSFDNDPEQIDALIKAVEDKDPYALKRRLSKLDNFTRSHFIDGMMDYLQGRLAEYQRLETLRTTKID